MFQKSWWGGSLFGSMVRRRAVWGVSARPKKIKNKIIIKEDRALADTNVRGNSNSQRC